MRARKRHRSLHGVISVGVLLALFVLPAPDVDGANLIADSNIPELWFNDLQDQDCSSRYDWVIRTEGGTSDADVNNFFTVNGVAEVPDAQSNCLDVEILRINHNGASGANSPEHSLVIDTSGDLHFANDGMFFDRGDGRLGIGTTVPASKLHVLGATPPQFVVQNGAGNARMDFRRAFATNVSQLLFGTGPVIGGTMDYQIGMFLDTTFQIRVTNQPTLGIALTQSGNVGIGTTTPTPAAKLDVAGVVRATGFDSTSDARLKDNIAPIKNALGKVMQTDGVTFTWKKEEGTNRGFPDGTHYGVVAQQVEKVLPEVVRTAPGGEKAVSYTELVPVLIEALKEQQKIIAELRDRITSLEMESGHRGKIAATSFAE